MNQGCDFCFNILDVYTFLFRTIFFTMCIPLVCDSNTKLVTMKFSFCRTVKIKLQNRNISLQYLSVNHAERIIEYLLGIEKMNLL